MKGICGRSMIEMLGVLAIIGVLSAGGIMGYSTAMENYRVNRFIEDSRYIVANTVSLRNYTKTNPEEVINPFYLYQAGVLPSYYKVTSSTNEILNQPYGNDVDTVIVQLINRSVTYTYPHYIVDAKQYLRVELQLSSKAMCQKLMLYDWRNVNGAFLTKVCSVTTGNNCNYIIDDAPPSVDWTEQACQKHDIRGKFALVWYFFTKGTKTKR